MKTRLWICRQCGRSWHRKKHDDYPNWKCCGEYPTKGRVQPNYRVSKYERMRTKIQRFKNTYQIKPRTNAGTALQISPETKRIFRECLMAKTKPAFLRRAEKFVHSIHKDSMVHGTEKDREGLWCKSINERGEISKSKGGLTGIPEVKFSETLPSYVLGQYNRAILQGKYSIEFRKAEPLVNMPETLVHEVLHFIDDRCEMNRNNHDCYWDIRLERFRKMLGFKKPAV